MYFNMSIFAQIFRKPFGQLPTPVWYAKKMNKLRMLVMHQYAKTTVKTMSIVMVSVIHDSMVTQRIVTYASEAHLNPLPLM